MKRQQNTHKAKASPPAYAMESTNYLAIISMKKYPNT